MVLLQQVNILIAPQVPNFCELLWEAIKGQQESKLYLLLVKHAEADTTAYCYD